MKRVIVPSYLFIVILVVMVVFPLFPEIMKSSQSHIMRLILCVTFFSLFSVRKLEKRAFIFIGIAAIQCLLMFLGFAKEITTEYIAIHYIITITTPLIFFALMVGMYSLVREDMDNGIAIIIDGFKCLVIISLAYSLFELLFITNIYQSSIVGMYKRLDNNSIQTTITTFFGTTYFAGYFYTSLFFVFFSIACVSKKMQDYTYSIVLLFLVFMSQSKIMLLTVVVGGFLIILLANNRKLKIILFVLSVLLLALVYHIDSFVNLLFSLNINSAKSLAILIDRPGYSYTLLARIEQINFAILAVANNALFGAGIGKGILLESWIAKILYQMGGLGVITFLSQVIVLTVFNYLNYKRASNEHNKGIALGLLVWSLCLPLSQLSSYTFYLSKMGILSAVLIILTLALYEYEVKMKRNSNQLC
ncbi:hypothetical protein [Vibrio sp. T20]|uniref:hypothetical protein n=1 Tax=Vibrio sp. T20 TaxID=2588450 RepID=UPI0011B61770|nr:hypothetical protein [Vibrio sp. T20]